MKNGCDTRSQILYTNFDLLVYFIEKEKPFVYINWNTDEEHIFAELELKDLYRWWKVVRAREWEALDAIEWRIDPTKPYCTFTKVPGTDYSTCDMESNVDNEKFEAYVNESARLEQKDLDQMIRLIKVSPHMWV